VLFDYEKLHQWCRSLVRKFAITRKHATKIQHERDLWQARTSQAATHIAIKETSAGFLDLTRQQVLNQIRSPTFFLSEGRICYHSTIWGPDILRNVIALGYVAFYQITNLS